LRELADRGGGGCPNPYLSPDRNAAWRQNRPRKVLGPRIAASPAGVDTVECTSRAGLAPARKDGNGCASARFAADPRPDHRARSKSAEARSTRTLSREKRPGGRWTTQEVRPRMTTTHHQQPHGRPRCTPSAGVGPDLAYRQPARPAGTGVDQATWRARACPPRVEPAAGPNLPGPGCPACRARVDHSAGRACRAGVRADCGPSSRPPSTHSFTEAAGVVRRSGRAPG